MKNYEKNWADQDLIVRRLKVLDKIDGGGLTEIRQSVEAVKKQSNALSQQQEKYWKALSDDGIISVIEKQNLKREIENIKQSYIAVTNQASTLGYQSTVLDQYTTAYNTLYGYLYNTLKLFDDMNSETNINDRDYFNTLFANYFYLENFILLAITQGILDTINIRVLSNLEEEGEEGETALYKGGLYQHTDGAWVNVKTGDYQGALTQVPVAAENNFFLAADNFTYSDTLYVNSQELYVNGEPLGVGYTMRKGYIYYCVNGVWYIEENKTNWRYAAAFADVLNVTGELPQIFQDGLDSLQDQIDDMVSDLADEIAARRNGYTIINGDLVRIDDYLTGLIENINDEFARKQTDIDSKINHLPEYFGALSNVASLSPQEGDFFVYSGTTTASWEFAKIYRWHNSAWQGLDSDDVAYRNYYMLALEDILRITNISTNPNYQETSGYFTSVFAHAFFSNTATLESLSVQTIYLKGNGVLMSQETQYSPESYGLRIDANGNIDANENTHIGGTCVIDGNTTIGGNTTISGNTVIGGNTDFYGSINQRCVESKNGSIIGTEITIPVGSIIYTNLNNGYGYYGNQYFTKIEVTKVSNPAKYVKAIESFQAVNYVSLSGSGWADSMGNVRVTCDGYVHQSIDTVNFTIPASVTVTAKIYNQNSLIATLTNAVVDQQIKYTFTQEDEFSLLKLKGLPRFSLQKDMVYVDNDGYLRISQ